MLLGKVIATVAMQENKHVTWLPSYGAEVRGGTAHCAVIISDEEIGSPWVDKADTLIAMNEPSLKRFKPRLKNKGLLIANSSMVARPNKVKGAKVVARRFTDEAVELGNIKVANTVALGCFIAENKIIRLKSALEAIRKMAPSDRPDLVEINSRALSAGFELAREKGRNGKG